MNLVKVFVSYHHENDQIYIEKLRELNLAYRLFDDYSVQVGEIDDKLDGQSIRRKIRDEYLKNSTVTIVLVGSETKNRKHIDWEIYSSMIDGSVNKKSGILVILLPGQESSIVISGHGEDEKKSLYPQMSNWRSVTNFDVENNFKYLPKRIKENLSSSKSYISVANWTYLIKAPTKIKELLNFTNRDREKCEYDLSLPMMRKNI